MEKRLIIAIVLVFIILFLVPQLFRPKRQPSVPAPSPSLFGVGDFKDIASLAVKLQNARDPLSQYLREQFSEETRLLLDGYDSSIPVSQQLQKALQLQEALVDELNPLLQKGDSLYDEQLFAHVALTEETRKLIAENPTGEELVRLNRMLLEDAYPREIVKSQRPKVVQGKKPEAEPPRREIPPPVSEETIITVQTPLYEVQLTTEGARAVSWKLKEYLSRPLAPGKKPEHIDIHGKPVTATSSLPRMGPEYLDLIPPTAEKCLAMQFGNPELQGEMADAQWTPDKESVIVEDVEGAQDSVEFSYTTSTGIAISKKMTFFRDSYVVDLDIGFHNSSSEKNELDYDLCWGAGIAKDEIISDAEVANEGPIALLKTAKGTQFVKHWHRTGFACFGGKHTQIPAQGGPIFWVGFASKYFAAVLIPGPELWWSDSEKEGKRYAVVTDARDTVLPPKDVWKEWGTSTTVALAWPGSESVIAAGETVLHRFRVYVGPKKWDILRAIEGRDGSTESLGLGKMVNFGMFSPLGKATLWLLKVFYRVGNNYGVAIIFLTILIKILYFPLTQKSFKSMRKMQELQPRIVVLKDRYRDDPQRLNKETLKLYKQHGASPMGGCLPMLFQIPVFWALFATLRSAVEMRGAMFIPGWITDLSLPDTVAAIAGFPIRILPLLMTGSMLLQQFIFGTGNPGQSSKMMAFMPLIFAFIFYGMPSGLVLYWFCNNILAIGHQYLIRRQQGTETEDREENKGKKTHSARKGK
jgi:YidC/Oxa1 family membrane protein insertase